MPTRNAEASIIEIIQKMIKEGQSEAAIIKTLKELGVEPAQAQNLLRLGQANTFAVIEGDLAKLVKVQVEKERESLKRNIREEVEKTVEGSQQKVLSTAIQELQAYERDIESQRSSFQERMQETIGKVSFLSEKVKEKLNELGSAVRQVQFDMDELKVRGIGARNKYISYMLIVLGVVFALVDLYLLINSFQSTLLSVDSMIIMVVLAMVSITMLFVSTLI
ncbi:MAG: hypothetical protein HYW50_03340 [Candidatus Diapherotrites archaeon]|nr:hypothetical protein [Candidatus Diapherotrites archaeon]